MSESLNEGMAGALLRDKGIVGGDAASSKKVVTKEFKDMTEEDMQAAIRDPKSPESQSVLQTMLDNAKNISEPQADSLKKAAVGNMDEATKQKYNIGNFLPDQLHLLPLERMIKIVKENF